MKLICQNAVSTLTPALKEFTARLNPALQRALPAVIQTGFVPEQACIRRRQYAFCTHLMVPKEIFHSPANIETRCKSPVLTESIYMCVT